MKHSIKIILPLICMALAARICAAQQGGPDPLQSHSPLSVNGQVLMDTGHPVPEPVSVALVCGASVLQVVRTDSKGYFQFDFGGGAHAYVDASVSSSAPANGMDLHACEVQVVVPGYKPLRKAINAVSDSQINAWIDVGSLHIERTTRLGSAISLTSLMVPSSARKEFDKGDKEARSNHLELATQHFEKAVAEYDKYATAWNALGKIYSANHEIEKSCQAFEKAIAADPHYIPPYVGLADLRLQNEEYESAVETAGTALEMDPHVGLASFIQAAAYFKLNRLDSAEKSAKDAENEPYPKIPDLHVLLAAIFRAKKDDLNAAVQMQAYLKELPQGKYAGEMKTELKQIAQSTTAGQ